MKGDFNVRYNFFTGEGLSRPQSAGTCFDGHKNSSKAIEQARDRNIDRYYHHHMASFDGNCYDQSTSPAFVTACCGSFHFWQHMQDNIRGYHLCVHYASI